MAFRLGNISQFGWLMILVGAAGLLFLGHKQIKTGVCSLTANGFSFCQANYTNDYTDESPLYKITKKNADAMFRCSDHPECIGLASCYGHPC